MRAKSAASLFDFRVGSHAEPGAGVFSLGMAALRLAMHPNVGL